MKHHTKHFFVCALLCITFQSIYSQQCERTSTGLIPLTDLGIGTYDGYLGGLYPGGTNQMPYNHYQAGMKQAKRIKPLDIYGNVDPVAGQVVMVGMGASVASHVINRLIDSAFIDASVNPCLRIMNDTYGGKGMELMYGDTADWYFDKIITKLTDRESSPDQVQIIWFYHSLKGLEADDPNYIDSTIYTFQQVLPYILSYYKNVKQLFISGLHYGNYADTCDPFYNERTEPANYLNNIAVREVISLQINGDTSLAYRGTYKRSPWLAWGPNYWADGINPRIYDGLSWQCSDYRVDDGFHSSDAGEIKEMQLLQTFLKTTPYTNFWYLDSPNWTSCNPARYGDFDNNVLTDTEDPSFIVWLYPEPEKQNLYIDFQGSESGNVQVFIYNLAGQVVYENNIENAEDATLDISTSQFSKGLYIANFELNGKRLTKKFIVN